MTTEPNSLSGVLRTAFANRSFVIGSVITGLLA
jgi:hypothetical protein